VIEDGVTGILVPPRDAATLALRLRELLADGSPDAPADEALLRACVQVLAGWGWGRRPGSVVAMPSRRRPQLITSVAAGLAEVGRLPFLGTLELRDGHPAGTAGGNSAYRLAAVWDAFTVPDPVRDRLGTAPVLLVDDSVDSRWSLTVAGRALRRAGATEVLPFALALTG
jgi:ATP-dependent DNA helicase RecQ